MEIEKAYEINEAKIQFVSLVDKAANKHKFCIVKSEDERAEFSTYGKIIKTDSDTHYVTGIVYEPMVEDAHHNYMTAEEIKKAAHYFHKNCDKIDIQHSFESADGISVVENYIAPCDMKIGDTIVKCGSWVLTAEIENPDVWDAIQKGEITGLSMGGTGKYSSVDADLNVITKSSFENEKRGILKTLASFFGIKVLEKDSTDDTVEKDLIIKAGKKMSGKNKETLKSIYDNLGAFLTDFDDEKEDTDVTKSELQAIVNDAVAKAVTKSTGTEAETAAVATPEPAATATPEVVTPDSIQKMIEAALEKALTPTEEALTPDAIQAMVTAAVTKAVEPILKSRGVPSNLSDGKPVEKSGEAHYLAGVL